MHQIELAGLFGTRESADDLVERAGLPSNLAGDTVTLFCRDLLSGSSSFADQLVESLLTRRNADAIHVVGAPERFRKHIVDAAKRRNIAKKIHLKNVVLSA